MCGPARAAWAAAMRNTCDAGGGEGKEDMTVYDSREWLNCVGRGKRLESSASSCASTISKFEATWRRVEFGSSSEVELSFGVIYLSPLDRLFVHFFAIMQSPAAAATIIARLLSRAGANRSMT